MTKRGRVGGALRENLFGAYAGSLIDSASSRPSRAMSLPSEEKETKIL